MPIRAKIPRCLDSGKTLLSLFCLSHLHRFPKTLWGNAARREQVCKIPICQQVSRNNLQHYCIPKSTSNLTSPNNIGSKRAWTFIIARHLFTIGFLAFLLAACSSILILLPLVCAKLFPPSFHYVRVICPNGLRFFSNYELIQIFVTAEEALKTRNGQCLSNEYVNLYS